MHRSINEYNDSNINSYEYHRNKNQSVNTSQARPQTSFNNNGDIRISGERESSNEDNYENNSVGNKRKDNYQTRQNYQTSEQQPRNDQKVSIDQLEKQLIELEKTKKDVVRYLEVIKAERSNIDYKNNSSFEINKLVQENQTLKSDNIIYKEDLLRMTELNKRLEDDLVRQRHRK